MGWAFFFNLGYFESCMLQTWLPQILYLQAACRALPETAFAMQFCLQLP
jgi:hypothetical protein